MATSYTNVVRKFYADGRVEDVSERMTLEQLQAFVGGDIEWVATTIAHRALFVHGNALLDDPIPPVNVAATRLVKPGTLMQGGIRGPALLVKD